MRLGEKSKLNTNEMTKEPKWLRRAIFLIVLCLLSAANTSAQVVAETFGLDAPEVCETTSKLCEPEFDGGAIPPEKLKPLHPKYLDMVSLPNGGRSDRFDQLIKNVNEEDACDPSQPAKSEKFHWKPAIAQSMAFLGAQHGFRMIQRKTTRELVGPFFRDWGQSVRNLKGWRDGDSIFVNYVAHPMQGSLTGRIFVNNSDNAKKQRFGKSKEYWRSRAKAFVWSTVWSTQFEIGPISEASLGNVGLRPRGGRRSTGYVDYVITPTVGTGWLVGEDAIDRYVLKGWAEKKSNGRLTRKVKILRSFLTPTASVANLLRWKSPWKRDDR
jgi:hypothetical protein